MDNTEIAWWAQRAAQRRLVPKEMRKAKIHLWRRLMVKFLVQVTVGIRATVLGTEVSVGIRSKVKRLRMNTKGTATEHAASSSRRDPAASTDDVSRLPLTGLPMSTSKTCSMLCCTVQGHGDKWQAPEKWQ